MTTAIIGVGKLGSSLAGLLVKGGRPIVLAARDASRAQTLADDLAPLARAATVEDAIDGADAVVFAVWLDTLKELVTVQSRRLEGKVVVDPSNPIRFDESGAIQRTLPDGLSAGIVTNSLKHSRHFRRNVKAGMVMINLPTAGVDYHVPFGGTRKSSYGSREQGFAAVEFYTQIKTVYTGG